MSNYFGRLFKGLFLPSVTNSSPNDGEIWRDSGDGQFKFRQNGTTQTLGGGGSTSTIPSASGFMTSNGTGWATSSSSFGDFSTDAGSTYTSRVSIGFPTITKESTNLPGITFTPTATGYYEVTVVVSFNNGNNGGGAVFQLVDGANSPLNSIEANNGSGNAPVAVTLTGLYHISSLSATTFKLYGRNTGGGTTTIGGNLVGSANAMEWTVKLIYPA